METIWKADSSLCKGAYISKIKKKGNYQMVAGPGYGQLAIRKEHAIEIADALYKSEGLGARAELARVQAENERMREAIKVSLRSLESLNKYSNSSRRSSILTGISIELSNSLETEATPPFGRLLGSVPGLTGDKSTEEFINDIRKEGE